MKTRGRKIAAGIAALAALALGGAAIASATGGSDQQLSGDTATKASAAALKAVGGGKVTGSEQDGEKGATYEVEVTKTDGSVVDVRLDASYKVVAVDGDSERADDQGQDDQGGQDEQGDSGESK
jgi:hypothetical protein